MHCSTEQAISDLRWVCLQARAAAVEHGGLGLRPNCLRIAAAAPLLATLEAPAMIPAEELPILDTPYAERCKSACIAASVNSAETAAVNSADNAARWYLRMKG